MNLIPRINKRCLTWAGAHSAGSRLPVAAGQVLLAGLLTLPALSALGQQRILYVDHLIDTSGCPDYQPAARACGAGNQTAYQEIPAAAAAVSPGTTVLIQPGVYAGGIVVNRGGTETEPVVIQGNGPDVVISGSGGNRDAIFITEADHVHVAGIEVEGANRAGLRISLSDYVQIRDSVFRDNGSWGIFTDFSDHTLVENCEASGSSSQHGIYISNSSDYPVIRNNRIHHNAAAGLHMNGDANMGGDGLVSHATIENNIIYENGQRGASGINLDGVTHSVIRNNLLYDNHASGISVYRIDGASESHSNRIMHNTILNGRFSRWALNMPSTENNLVFNNILLNLNRFRGSISVGLPIGSGFQSDHNVLMDSFLLDGDDGRRLDLEAWQALGFDQHSRLGQPGELFVNWAGDDFHLQAGSVAVAAGIVIPDVDRDLSGNPRTATGLPDIGAYQWQP